jgi:hypothetical protein
MKMMTTRMQPIDEQLHAPTDDPAFNESAVFHFVGEADQPTMLLRIGNRANQGHAEVTVLGILPGGGAFMHFERAPIAGNEGFAASGLRFEVVEPFSHWKVAFDGEVRMMAKSSELEDPKKVFSTNPVSRLTIDLDYRDISHMYGYGSAHGESGFGGEDSAIGTSHYHGLVSGRGTMVLDGVATELSGHGFRDHSWGPRHWQGPVYWRWIGAMADEDNWFEAWSWQLEDSQPPDFAAICRDGEFQIIDDVTFETTYGPAPHYAERVTLTLGLPEGPVVLDVRQVGYLPTRQRREGKVARILEMRVETELFGRPAVGMGEFHDRIVDGVPAGMGIA